MKINDEIEKVQKKINELNLQLTIEKAVLERLQGLTKKRRGSRKSSDTPRKDSLAAHLKTILEKSGGPLTVSDLVERLERNGFVSSATVGLNNLVPSALNRRNDIFIRVKRGVYDLKSRQKKSVSIE